MSYKGKDRTGLYIICIIAMLSSCSADRNSQTAVDMLKAQQVQK